MILLINPDDILDFIPMKHVKCSLGLELEAGLPWNTCFVLQTAWPVWSLPNMWNLATGQQGKPGHSKKAELLTGVRFS